MPSRNTVRKFAPESYYHVYNRGVNKRSIFKDDQDYVVFMGLLKRYLDPKNSDTDKFGRSYPNFAKEISLNAFCLMPNHFHLLIYQENERSITGFLKSLSTAYTMYFNKKYKRVGHLFQDRYKASLLDNDPYLLHISRYIHLNPKKYLNWEYSSLPYYKNEKHASWVKPQPILDLFEGTSYMNFLADYEDYRDMLAEIKYSLADSQA